MTVTEAEGQNRVHRALGPPQVANGTRTGTGTGSVMRFESAGRRGGRNGVGSGTRTSPLMQTNGLHRRELALEWSGSGDDSDGTETEAQRNRSAFLHDEELRAEEEQLLSYIREREAGTGFEEPRGSSRQEPRAPPSTISAAISASRERMEIRSHVRQQVSGGLEALNQTAPRGVESTAGKVERCLPFRL